MSGQQIDMILDLETADQLSARFNRCFETLEAGDDLFSPDAFFDVFPPTWRFQLQGPDAFAAGLRSIAVGEVSVKVLRTVPTALGFVTEHEETQHGAKVEVARRLWLCEVRDGQITASSATATADGTKSCGHATRSRPRCSDPDPKEASAHEGRIFGSSTWQRSGTLK